MYCVVIQNTETGKEAVKSKHRTEREAFEAGVSLRMVLKDLSKVEVFVIRDRGYRVSSSLESGVVR